MTVSYFDQTPSRAALWKRGALLAFTLGAHLAIANEAAAQQACGESTCAKGFTCVTVGATCPAIDCQDGENCAPCEPKDYHMCTPAACDSDAACGADQVCAEQIVYDCPPSPGSSEPACPPGAECAAPQDFVAPECTPSTVSYCTPRWQLPCTVAADCGAGFDCVPQESCGSSGSAGTGSAGAPTPTPEADPAPPPDGEPRQELPVPPPEPPVTSCEPSGYSACVPIQVACDDDADCLSGWTCQANPNGVCWSGPNGSGCEPADPAKLCMPPYYGTRGGGGPGGDLATDGNSSPGTPTTSPIPESPQAPGTAPPFGAEGESADDAAAGTSGGCSVSASPSAAHGLAWLALGLAGIFGLRRRR